MTALHYFHYWSLKHTINAWGMLIVAANVTSPYLFTILCAGSIVSFFFDWQCMKQIKKEEA